MRGHNQKNPAEVVAEALRLVRAGVSCREVSGKLGVKMGTIYNWASVFRGVPPTAEAVEATRKAKVAANAPRKAMRFHEPKVQAVNRERDQHILAALDQHGINFA